MQAVADAVNANPGTTGQRVAVKLYQSGTSVLGVPFYVMVVGTPDNIANLDAGRNDAAFWRGVIDGTTSQSARARRGRHPARLRLDHRHPARQRAGGRRGLDEGALRAGRAHRLRQLAAAQQPRRVHPAGHGAGRPRPQRPHAGVGSRPEPGPRRGGDAGEPGAADLHRDVPGALLHRRAPAVVGLLLPAQRGRGAERDLALRARPDQRRDRAGDPAVVQRPERPVPQLQHLRPVRPRVRRHGAGADHGQRRHDVREGHERELRQAGLRPLPRHGHHGERGRGAQGGPAEEVDRAVAGGRPAGPGLQAAGQLAGQPGGDRHPRQRRVDDGSGPEHARLRLLLPAERALGRRGHDAEGPPVRWRPGLQAELGRDAAGRAPVRQLQPERARPARAADVHLDGDAAGLPGTAGRVAVPGAHGGDDTPGGNALRPAEPGQQALDPGSARGEPVPALPVLLRPGDLVVLDAAGLQRKRLPHAAAARRDVDEPRGRPERDDAGRRGVAGVRVQHGLDVGPLDGEPASRARERPSTAGPRRSTRSARTSRPAPRSSTERRSRSRR